jgi:hypothetical protein
MVTSGFFTQDGFITHYYEHSWLFMRLIPDASQITILIIHVIIIFSAV